MRIITDYFFRYFNYLFALVIAAMYANALIFPNMGVDASFYLRVVECVADGAIPGFDLKIMYPPFVFYLLLPIKLVVGESIAYEIFLGFMFCIQIINAILIFSIAKRYSANKFITSLAALLYLFLSYKLEGEYFVLEPFVNLWGLLVIFIYLRWGINNYYLLFLAGLISIFGFLTKQYGIVYVVILYLFILTDNRSKIKALVLKSAAFSLGIVFSLLVFYGIYYYATDSVYKFFGDSRLSIYGVKSVLSMIKGIWVYIYIGVFLFALFIPVVFIRILKTNKHIIPYIVLLFLFSFQLYFNDYLHYYMLMVPAILLIGVLMFEAHIEKHKALVFIVILISLFVNDQFIGRNTHNIILSKDTSLNREIKLAKEINKIVPQGARAYVFDNVRLYYLCHFAPSMPQKYGFVWDHTITVDEIDEIFHNTEYFIFKKNTLNTNSHFLDGKILRSDIISSHKLIEIGEARDYIIYTAINEK